MSDDTEDVSLEELEQGPWTVSELMMELRNLHPGLIIVLAKDSNGDSFSPLMDIGRAAYTDHGDGTGAIGESGLGTGEECIVLWPGA